MNNKRNLRNYTALFLAIVGYLVFHEGAHWVYAICIGSFKQINFLGIGVQIDIYRELMSDIQLGIFCLVGTVATLIIGYTLLLFANRIILFQSVFLRAVGYYFTLVFLVLDPLYLSVLSFFVGGGDMNGISLIFPEMVVRTLSGVIAAINIFIFLKVIVPKYGQAFQKSTETN
jgi:hypothetical protein